MNEKDYESGRRGVWVRVLNDAIRGLGYQGNNILNCFTERAKLISEREAAISSLRSLCGDFGDNEWDETLHLEDVIEKHLADHLYSNNKIEILKDEV